MSSEDINEKMISYTESLCDGINCLVSLAKQNVAETDEQLVTSFVNYIDEISSALRRTVQEYTRLATETPALIDNTDNQSNNDAGPSTSTTQSPTINVLPTTAQGNNWLF